MTPHSFSLSAIQHEGIERATAALNATLPPDAESVTANQYWDDRVREFCDSLAFQHCARSGFALAQRFTREEYDAITERAQTDAEVAKFIARLLKPDPINVASPKFWAALQYLYELGLIDESRVNAIAGITVSGGLTVTVG